jgi:hypothetical protein
MKAINKSHGCAKKQISSRYCYAAIIISWEFSFLLEAFKHHCNRPFHSPLEGIGIVFLHHLPFFTMHEEISIRELKSPPKEEEGTHKSLTFSTVFFLLIY